MSLLRFPQSLVRHGILLAWTPILVAAAPVTRRGELQVLPHRVLAVFRPVEAFGVAIDGGSAAETLALFDSKNATPIRAAHFKSVSYRLRTELAGEVWHWTTSGRWSDEDHHQGYWVGDAQSDDDHELTFGYRLPRRGNSRDEANDDGFSRLDDGDATSFWKSNPYLDPALDGTGVERQWVIVDLGRTRRIDTARIVWATPYASKFRLQRWVGSDRYDGQWHDLTPSTAGRLGAQAIAFDAISARFVRILLEQSSHVPAGPGEDRRDAMGYAIRELGIGTASQRDGFEDYVRHDRSGRRQTQIIVSSTDPWHRALDLDPDTVQPSPIALHSQGLFEGPFMIPVGLLTDTPENAVAELRYFRRRGLPIDLVELGEEPEGQLAPPRMVGALYRRLALRIAREAPEVSIGGPSLIDPVADTTLDGEDESWTKAFVQSLQPAQRSSPIAFLSTELYPVEDLCEPAARMLNEASRSSREMTDRFREAGAAALPAVITEYGLSPYGGRALLGTVSALADAELLATSLSQGVRRLYLYGSSPTSPVGGERSCAGWGNLTLWNSDGLGHIRSPSNRLRVFEALRDRWSDPSDAEEEILAVAGAPPGLDAFAVRRGDRSVSLLLVNRTAKSLRFRLAAPGSMTASNSTRTIIADSVGPATSPTSHWSREAGTSVAREIAIGPGSLTILISGDALRRSAGVAVKRQDSGRSSASSASNSRSIIDAASHSP